MNYFKRPIILLFITDITVKAEFTVISIILQIQTPESDSIKRRKL